MLILISNLLSLLISFAFIFFIQPNWYFHPLIYIGGLIIGLLLFLIACLLLSFILVKDKNNVIKPRKTMSNIVYIVAKFVISICNVKIISEGFEKLENTNCLFVSNHQSMMDPITIIASNKNIGLSFVMRQNVEKIPIIGRCLVCGGFLTINRSDNREGLLTIRKAISRVENGYPIGIFPEGTRSKGPNMGPFHDGAFKISVRSQSDICVVVIDNEYNIHKRSPFRRTKVYCKVCDILKYEDIKDMNTHEIGIIVRQIMEKGLLELREKYPIEL